MTGTSATSGAYGRLHGRAGDGVGAGASDAPPRPAASSAAVPALAALTVAALALMAALLPAGPGLPGAQAYRVHDPQQTVKPTTPAFFPPYVDGFVGRAIDPNNPGRRRVNEGNQHTLTQPNLFTGVLPRQACPGMIGPIEKMFYCTSQEAGYCDRRSGACFCNYGYRGDDCSECAFTHYRDPGGVVCLPKKLCPADCSGAGTCDWATGVCKCDVHRVGKDCGERFCAKTFDPRCQACDAFHCSRCSDGFFLTSDDKCQPCTDWDPRCIFCDRTQCLVCGDPLLTSVRRSGQRRDDTALPFDEFDRELSIAIPFGSQSVYAFEEAEPFIINPAGTSAPPLSLSSKACHQGLNDDAEFVCVDNPVSHKVCGHAGTVYFASPTYSTWENSTFMRIIVRRTGGGLEQVRINYHLVHNDTTPDDVSATAYFTAAQELVFNPGVTELSFLVTINDDTTVEHNETFSLVLQEPDAAVSTALGPQRQTFVTIHDDDLHLTNHLHCTATGPALEGPNTAGEVAEFTIVARTPTGEQKPFENFVVELIDKDAVEAGHLGANASFGEYDFVEEWTPRLKGPALIWDVVDNILLDGTYTASARPLVQGDFRVNVQLATVNGLLGEYFSNAWLHGERESYRTDHVVNFTWGEGRITRDGTDWVSARWTGKVKTPAGGLTQQWTFYLVADDNARLWVDYELIIDKWISYCGDSYGVIRLEADHLYDIRVEYRDRTGDAKCQLMWAPGPPGFKERAVIPMENLYLVRHIPGSPFPISVQASLANTIGSVATGDGLVGTVAGQTAHFEIISRDEFLNDRGLRGANDVYKVIATYEDISVDTELPLSEGRGATILQGDIVFDAEAGVHRVSYTPTLSGTYTLEVQLRTGVNTFSDIEGSPFRVFVQPGPTSPIASDIWGQGVVSGTAGDEFRFNIRTRDSSYNVRRSRGDAEQIEILDVLLEWAHRDKYHDAPKPGTVGAVEDVLQGDYVGRFWPKAAGTHLLAVTLSGNHIDESPYTVVVAIDAPFGGTSVADGAGLANSTSDQESYFTVYVRDEHGNPRDAEGGTVVVSLSGPATVLGESDDNKDGTFACAYTPTKSGWYDIDVTVDGGAIIGSPFRMLALPGVTFGLTSSAVGVGLTDATAGVEAAFVVQARDLNGNDKLTSQAADAMTCHLEAFVNELNDDGQLVTVTKTVDACACSGIGSGQYDCRYTATIAKQHDLIVRVNGQAILGSPFKPVVVPAPFDAALSVASDTGLVSGEAGVLAPVYLRAVDAFNNDLGHGGDAAELEAYLEGADDIKLSLQDLGNGNYYLPYTPTVAGDYTLHINQWVGGGLTATYYRTIDFLEPMAVLIDSHIDFNWARTTPLGAYNFSGHSPGVLATTPHANTVEADAGAKHLVLVSTPHASFNNSEYYSVRWEGWVRPEFDEWYTWTVDVEGDARVWLEGDLIVDAWPASTSRHASAPARLEAGRFYAIRVDYRTALGPSSIKLSWSSANFAPESTDVAPGDAVVPASRFYLHYPVSGGPFHPHIVPTATSSANCEAWGSGLAHATANLQSSFTVHLRDRFNNSRRVGTTDLVQVVGERTGPGPPPDGRAHVEFVANVADNGDATFLVTYVPVVNGIYSLRVTVNAPPVHADLGPTAVAASIDAGHIENSPFVLDVSDGVAVAMQSSAEGAGLTAAEAGVRNGFTVQVRDVNGNARTDDKDAISVVATRDTPRVAANGFETPVTLTGVATYRAAGLYDVAYDPTDSGTFSLSVKVNGNPIIDSPWTLVIQPTYAHAATSTAFEPQLTPVSRVAATSPTNATASFTIRAKDRFDNYLALGGDRWVVRAIGPESVVPPMRGLVADNGDGSYTATFQPRKAGPYLVHVGLARARVHVDGLSARYWSNRFMRGEPALSRVDPTVDFDWTRAGGDAIGALVTLGWATMHTSAEWTGFVEPEHPEHYTFIVTSDDGARLWVGEQLLIDGLDQGPGERSGTTSFRMLPGQLYEVRLQYRQLTSRPLIRLEWRTHATANTPRAVVPDVALFPDAPPIKDSPFDFTAT